MVLRVGGGGGAADTQICRPGTDGWLGGLANGLLARSELVHRPEHRASNTEVCTMKL